MLEHIRFACYTYQNGGLWDTRYNRIAGSLLSCGYIIVSYGGQRMLTHRIIWELHYGPIPAGLIIDHINGVRHDNRIENLRLATRAENSRNCTKHRDNTSGFKGVSWNKRQQKWECRIYWGKRFLHLGYFDCPIIAAQAYDAKAIELFGEFAKVNFPLKEFVEQPTSILLVGCE